ncbi:MAG: hypothetical protein L6R42_007532 [Xanthoria sp. 1 TBL-2021]|nr:MAG: hypothetical protein L6R42_007532 [Xanthoria sp. 1 TBL-2021]
MTPLHPQIYKEAPRYERRIATYALLPQQDREISRDLSPDEMGRPPTPQAAFKATKYDVGTKVLYYIESNDDWQRGEIAQLESSENGKKYKIHDAKDPDLDISCHIGELRKLRSQE